MIPRRHPSSRPSLLLAVLLVLGLAGIGLEPAWGDVLAVEGGTVRADEGLEDLAQEAARWLPRIRREVSDRLAWPAPPPAEVVIVRGLDRMRTETRAAVPEWAVGATVGARSLVVIRADLLRAGYGGGIVPVLRHEWVHLAWAAYAGPNRRRLPLWVEEGIAEEVGGGITVDAGAALDVAAAFDRLIPLDDLRERFPAKAKDADLAYKQGRSWIQHFTTHEDWNVLREILAEVAEQAPDADRPRTFDDILRRRTGVSLGGWEASWRDEVKAQAAPWFHLLLRDVPGLLLVLTAFLALGLFFVLRAHRRRQIARLPDDGETPPGAA